MSGTSKEARSLPELEQSHAAHLRQLEAVRSHLSGGGIPGVPADGPAARAVLRGIDEEVTRSTREYRLRRRFERERIQNLAAAAGGSGGGGQGGECDMNDDDDDDEGWQDVTPPRTTPDRPSAADGEHAAAAGTSPASTAGEGDLRSSPVQLMEASSGSIAGNHGGSGGGSGSAASPLGQALAEMVTRSVADARARVSSPVAAVALALHAAMRTEVLGFKCTGMPPDEDGRAGGGGGGFAAPIRELPKNKFLPDGWDEAQRSTACTSRSAGANTQTTTTTTTRISLRYRKDGLGSTVLRVAEREAALHQPGGAISITVTSSTNSEPAAAAGAAGRSFDASQHINLAGLAAAITSERQRLGISPTSKVEVRVSPVLHYLDLAGLMTTFVTSFDLGAIRDPTISEEERAAATSTAAAAAAAAAASNGSGSNSMEVDGGQQSRPYRKQVDPSSGNQIPPIPTPSVPGVASPPRLPTGPGIPQPGRAPRIEDLDPSLRRPGPGPGGDFGGDLAPGGILDPRRGMSQEDNRGSLMGPNHPAFRGPGIGGGDDDFGYGGEGGGYGLEDPRMPHIGGTGMAPRFDPYYPPGVGPDLGRGGRGRGMGRGGRGGRGRGRRPPPSGGDPNPDHLQPPNSFNSDMFM